MSWNVSLHPLTLHFGLLHHGNYHGHNIWIVVAILRGGLIVLQLIIFANAFIVGCHALHELVGSLIDDVLRVDQGKSMLAAAGFSWIVDRDICHPSRPYGCQLNYSLSASVDSKDNIGRCRARLGAVGCWTVGSWSGNDALTSTSICYSVCTSHS